MRQTLRRLEDAEAAHAQVQDAQVPEDLPAEVQLWWSWLRQRLRQRLRQQLLRTQLLCSGLRAFLLCSGCTELCVPLSLISLRREVW